ncbi:DUF72 domain-containing protein [Microbacterium lushaniae]|uniref:DUF72 domain-containing protein n=1 Tax=Microbacterium lushaniae TaxID=2614639 RepID=A0A5J6L0N0_9MICO|nr:DUF72 domain-containing protein [Microbacterium lushaniae]QEW01982.1 DUF72 domain-containing protein [Microbacterium lushaniae]
MSAPRARIGTSGWSYPHWRGVLYERGTRDQLARYVQEFDTVELNTSFYRWPRAERFAAWRDRLPPGFELAIKAPRGVTHARSLQLTPEWQERIATGLAAVGSKRGPFLAQLPPGAERDDARLTAFLEGLPPDSRPVMELRHPSWVDEAVFQILERHGAAYCVMSGAGLPCVLRATASFVYVRLHGPDDTLYNGSYSPDAIAWWADRIREWLAQGRDVYAYFNNDLGGNAVRDAWALRDALA